MADALTRILEAKRAHVAGAKAARSLESLRDAAQTTALRDFAGALEEDVARHGLALIAEIKRASPSRGLIRPDFDPKALALAYSEGGASCLSVLTDGPYFRGADVHLRDARAACALPVLRKDFVVDRWQVHESRALGADCILIIVAAFDDDALARELVLEAREIGMAVLIEIHDEAELERALALPASLLGINNRNLKTLTVDLATTERLAPLVPDNRRLVCESGLYDHADLVRMQAAGASRFLVGESLMREADVTAATSRLLGRVPAE